MSKQSKQAQHHRYWRANLRLVALMLALWFLFGCGLSIFWVEQLNRVRVGGFPLGFWVAQQGCTLAFIGLVWSYAVIMRRLDRKYGVEEQEEKKVG